HTRPRNRRLAPRSWVKFSPSATRDSTPTSIRRRCPWRPQSSTLRPLSELRRNDTPVGKNAAHRNPPGLVSNRKSLASLPPATGSILAPSSDDPKLWPRRNTSDSHAHCSDRTGRAGCLHRLRNGSAPHGRKLERERVGVAGHRRGS